MAILPQDPNKDPNKPAQPLPQFEAMRRRLGTQGIGQQQEAQDQLKRQFARTGDLGSGTYVKVQERMQDALARRQQEANENIGFAEQAEQARLGEAKTQREFASGEAEKQRQFTKDFQGGQFEKEFGLKEKATNRQLDLADKQFVAEQRDQAFNRLNTIINQGSFPAQEFLKAFEQHYLGKNFTDIEDLWKRRSESTAQAQAKVQQQQIMDDEERNRQYLASQAGG